MNDDRLRALYGASAGTSSSSHPSEDALAALAGGGPFVSDRDAVLDHVARCGECAEVLQHLVRCVDWEACSTWIVSS